MGNQKWQEKVNERWLLFGLIALALLLRLWALDLRSLWVDEVKLLERAAEFQASMLVESYFNPPLIYLIVNLWSRLSSDEVFMRILPAVVGALSVWPVYELGRRLFGSRVALLGALLFALSPFHVYYSQEINTYAFATLFGLIATLLLVRLVQGETSAWLWLGYGVAMVAGLYTHSYLTFFLAVHLVALPLFWREQRALWWAWLALYTVVGLFFLPRMLPVLTSLAPGGSASAWTELISPRLLTIRTALPAAAAMGYSYILGMTVEPLLPLLPLILLALLVAAVALALTWRAAERRPVFFLWLTFLLPLGLVLLISMTVTPIYSADTPRYMLFFLPAFLLLVAQGLLQLRPSWRWAGIAILLVVSGYSLYNYYYHWNQVGMGDYRTIAAHIKEAAQPGDVLVHTSKQSPTPDRKVSTASCRPINYYLGDEWESYVILDEQAWAETTLSLIEHDRLWLVFFNDTSMWQFLQAQFGWFTPNLDLPTWTQALSEAGFQQVQVREYPGRKYVAVYLFERERP